MSETATEVIAIKTLPDQVTAITADEAFPVVHPGGTVYSYAPGSSHPLGVTVTPHGVNFSVFSRYAERVVLLLFEDENSLEPKQTIVLTPRGGNKTFFFWHVLVLGLKAGTAYAYRVVGPMDPAAGFRYNLNKVLLDPYGYGVLDNLWKRSNAVGNADNVGSSMRSVVIDLNDYDWEGDKSLNRPISECIIYEMHVGGFTRSQTAGVQQPGTFSGIMEKIPYLQTLGINAVELLPVAQFDPQEMQTLNPQTGQALVNYWGYSTVSFFAPHCGYCSAPHEAEHIREFRDMVKALHKAGIEVILDVVFNHTSEGNHLGPYISFRGFDNITYYHLVSGDKQYYMDYSGCGNTLNCNHPITEKFIIECLEFWVREMHVDGFRFDEGSILSRGIDGAPMEFAPVLWSIDLSETLADTKIIAEAWDAGGLYQVDRFPGYRWAVWNGKFRDTIRQFLKGDTGLIGAVANAVSGSANMLQASGHLPQNSINFVTCHDGMTLNDLVSYNGKHNEANGEHNNDGINDNSSWNCGTEGSTADAGIERLRVQQIKNAAVMLFISQGVPMMLGGDEMRRTQQGNNNAYCQDNEISWYDWTLADKHAGLLRFWGEIVRFRKQHASLRRVDFFTGEINQRGLRDISWHGTQLDAPGWDDPEVRVLAFTLGGQDDDEDLHVMLNMYWEPLRFELPIVANQAWYRVVDTSLESPEDICADGTEVLITGSSYVVNGRSSVVLAGKSHTV